MRHCGKQFDEILAMVAKLDPANNERYQPRDDKTNGLLLADITHEFARFNVITGNWSIYDGTKWCDDQGSLDMEEITKMVATAIYVYAGDKDQYYREYVVRYGRRNVRMTMMQEARSYHHLSTEDFDRDPYKLNLLNGTLDLRKVAFHEHRQQDLLSCVANVGYDPNADCVLFKKFISEVCSVPDGKGGFRQDPEKVAYIQLVLGYSLIGDCREDQFWMLYGSTTRNGKSTLLSVICDLLGDYGGVIKAEALSMARRATANDEDIANLRGKRFAAVEEPSKQMSLDVARMKELTGRTKQSVSRKYEHTMTFVPEFKLFFATNALPTVTDDTLFTSGRCVVITFDRHFTKEEQDRDLRAKLLEERSGILNWLIEGLRQYYKHRTRPPRTVLDATEAYQAASDRVATFMQDCTEEVEGNNVTMRELYNRYTMWCKDCGYHAEMLSKFSENLKRHNLLSPSGTVRGKTHHNVIKNVAIIEEPGQYDWKPDTGESPF